MSELMDSLIPKLTAAVQQFQDIAELQHHVVSHRRFECPYDECPANFSEEQSWSEHLRLAHDEIPVPGDDRRDIKVEP